MFAWGAVGNQAFALPMVQQFPTDPTTQGYILAWDVVNQAIGYFPLSFAANGDASLAGNLNIAAGKVYSVDGTQVVGPRANSWTAMTGVGNTSTVYDPTTITLPQLAARVKSLQDALTTHGLIGT